MRIHVNSREGHGLFPTSLRIMAMAAPGVAGALAALSGHGYAAIVLLVLAVSSWLAWPAAHGLEDVPTALVLVIASATLAAQIAGWLGLSLLSNSWPPRLLLALLCFCAAAGGLVRRRSAAAAQQGGPTAVCVAAAPGLLMAGYALAWLVLPLSRRGEWFLGGDHVRHLIFVAELARTGGLDYSLQPYPRAWHSLVAFSWAAGAPTLNAAGLEALVSGMSTMTWLLYATLTLAIGLLGLEIARRVGLTETAASWCGLAAGAWSLWPTFLSNYMALGFETSILAGVLLAVALLDVVRHPGSLRSVMVCAAAAAVMLHTWQLLTPASAVLAGIAAGRFVHVRRSRGAVSVVGGVLIGAVALAWPAALAVISSIGIGHATDAQVVAPLPYLWLGASLLSVLYLALRHRRGSTAALGVTVWLNAFSAVGVAAVVGITLTTYYPSKVLWESALLGLPAVAVVLALTVRDVSTRWRSGRILRGAVVGCACLLTGACLANPALAVMGPWSSIDGGRVLAAITAPHAEEAQVVWLGRPASNGVIARVLLDFYRVEATQARTPQPPLSVTEECELLGRAQIPTVLSTEPEGAVRARYRCVTGLRVLAVDGITVAR